MSDKDGGPAFPHAPVDVGAQWATQKGMSLRDFFAAMAMAGRADSQGFHPKQIADAYNIADAMLVERLK